MTLGVLIGCLFSASSLYAEYIATIATKEVGEASLRIRDGADSKVMVEAFAKGLVYLEQASSIAPQLHYIRSAPSFMAMMDPMMPDAIAIDIMERELKVDPYNSALMLFLCLRNRHAGNIERGNYYKNLISATWPDSPPATVLEVVQ